MKGVDLVMGVVPAEEVDSELVFCAAKEDWS